VAQPVGLSEAQIIAELTAIEAAMEYSIPPTPAPQRQAILDAARARLEEKP